MKLTPKEDQNKSPKNQGNWWLVLSVMTLIFTPLIFIKGEYTGTDGQAHDAIAQIQPNYKPWMEALIKPQNSEVESFLFAFQAALGSGIIGYGIGFYKGRK